MTSFYPGRYASGVLVAVAILTGCSGSLNSPALSAPAAAPQKLLSRTQPDAEACGGSGGVKVRPCPVKLTKNQQMVEVTVSGPNVVNSAIKTNSKNRSGCGYICSVGQFTSDSLNYYVSAGTKCGTVGLSFYGYNQSGGTVGIGKLKVVNKDC
jgi:hypothetical protein